MNHKRAKVRSTLLVLFEFFVSELAKFIEQVSECITELNHSLRWDPDLRSGSIVANSLGDANKSAAFVFFQVHVISASFPDQNVRLDFAIYRWVLCILWT